MTISKLQLFTVIFSVLFSIFCSAQIQDNLIQKFSDAGSDSSKVIALLEKGEAIEATLPAKSFEYYQQALALSKKINNDRCLLSSIHDIGVCYIELNKLDSAILSFETAIPIANRLNDTIRVARLLANIGNVYLHKKDRIKGIEYYMQSAQLWETATDKNWLPIVYANINGLLNEQKEYAKALEYGDKALTLAVKIGDDNSIVNALINLSETYNLLGKYEQQYSLLMRALPLAKKNEQIEQIASVYKSLGDYYYQKKQFQSSLINYIENHYYVLKMGNKYALCTSYASLALMYNKLNKHDEALQNILLAEKLANEVGARADLKQIYFTRATIERKSGNYRLADEYLLKTITLTDSLFKAETSEKVAEVEAKYQNVKKQSEIHQLQKDKGLQAFSIQQKSTLNYFLMGFVAVLLVAGFIGLRNIRHRQLLSKQQEQLHRQRISELEKDKQLVAVDAMLKGQEEERSRLAKDLHDGLGGLLSGVKFSLSNMKDNLIITPDNMTVFERSLDMLDTSIRELRRVAHNMMPEMLTKFGLDEALKEYCNSINTSKILDVKYQSLGMETRLDKPVEIIIYRIIQELLNNTLKHAEASEVFVQIIRDTNRLNIVLEDNGKGFDTDFLGLSDGVGLTNVRSRVEYLKGELDIHAEAGKGTLVNIELNV